MGGHHSFPDSHWNKMGYCTWLATIVFCLMAITASESNETPEPSMMPFDNNETPEPSLMPFDVVEVEDDNEKDVIEHAEGERQLPPLYFMDTNPTVVNGLPVFEGDIMLTKRQWRAIRERKGLVYLSSRWDEGTSGYPVVPYIFTDNRLNKNVIEAGMNHWMEHTCITFEETTNTHQPHLRYIYGDGCYSSLGKENQNGQDISIGKGCESLGTVAHEIGHATGFAHEQSRPDRDNYLVINSENIPTNKIHNFEKLSTSMIDTHSIPYDYSSNMHYGSTGFSTNGKTTMATIEPLAQALIGHGEELSHRDKHLANIMYKCIDKWLAKCEKSSDPCQNGGYYGRHCACVCPPGTTGSNCETRTGGYYDRLLNSCTKKVTTEGNLTSPNYPNNYPEGHCVKWIVAPKCHVPKVTFSDFRLYGKDPHCNGNTCCYFDALEIRTTNKYYGDVFCDKDITAGQSFTGTNNEMILYFRTITNYYEGWSAELTFVKQDGCK